MKFILSSAFLLVALSSFAQGLSGLWLIEKVKVGDKEMTPDKKWTEFAKDGSFISGNGYLRNGEGTYQYDSQTGQLLMEDSISLKDKHGAFQTSIDDDAMYWERMEEGMKVQVYLRPIQALPMTGSDRIRGLWQGEDFRLFLRWDRAFTRYNADGSREYGVWRKHPHKNELALLPWSAKKTPQFFKIEESSYSQMILSDAEGDEKIKFHRIKSFE